MFGNGTCPEENSESIDQGGFWNSSGIDWDSHRVGWALAGGCAVLVSALVLVVCAEDEGINSWGDR